MKNLTTYGSYTAISEGHSILHIQCWDRRIIAYHMAGNRECEQLTGTNQLLLSICVFVYTEASSDESTAFVHSNGDNIYSQPQTTDRCRERDLARNRASKQSYDTFSPASVKALIW